MTSIQVAGMMIDSDGEGPPLVLLHGLGGTSNSFQAMLPALAGFRVVRPRSARSRPVADAATNDHRRLSG